MIEHLELKNFTVFNSLELDLYVPLITLDSPMLLPIIDLLERQRTNLSSKSVRWDREPLASCQVHNINTWHVMFPNWPVTRLSEAET